MAETNVKYLYPRRYDGDTITPPRRWKILMTSKATATADETDVKKIILGNLFTQNREVPSKLIIEKISFECTGFTSINLEFDEDDGNHSVYLIGGSNFGKEDWTDIGGYMGEGDLLLTTTGGSANDSYSITIDFRVKA